MVDTIRHLVPLNALRAFEAAGRETSFLKAAKELRVSPAAISHHVKVLEDFIGTPLFVRRNRSIDLTDAGRECLAELQGSFQRIETAALRLRHGFADGPLRVRVAPCLAAKWLLPRLDGFRRIAPDIEVQISVSSQIQEFRFQEMDMMIRLRAGSFRGFVVEQLMTEQVFAVCSPAFLARAGRIGAAADIRRLPLIHDDSLRVVETYPTWEMWFAQAGVTDAGELAGHRFDSSAMAIDAAIEGRGVCLGRSVLIERDLAAGRLVRLLPTPYPVTHDYFFIYAEGSVKVRKIRRFRDWLIREAQRLPLQPVPADTRHLSVGNVASASH
jgi:LysR family glycine cleavage system transcriptional activator